MSKALILYQRKTSSPRSSEEQESDKQEVEAAQKAYDWCVRKTKLAKSLRDEAERRVEEWERKNGIERASTFHDEDDVALMFGLESIQ